MVSPCQGLALDDASASVSIIGRAAGAALLSYKITSFIIDLGRGADIRASMKPEKRCAARRAAYISLLSAAADRYMTSMAIGSAPSRPSTCRCFAFTAPRGALRATSFAGKILLSADQPE